MNRSLNQVVDEIRVWAAAHVQVNEMAYGSIVDIYNRNEIDHCIVAINCNNVGVETSWVDLTLEIAVFDLVDQPTVEDGSRPQHEVESDTLQIINDLRKTIEYADRWKDWSEVTAASSAQKYVEHTSDAVTGWMMTLNLRVYSQPGVCDLPLIDYNYDGDYSAVCAPVKIYEDGVLVDTVASGGKYEYKSGGDCTPATYTVLDQFKNELAEGSIASGASADIEVDIPQTCSKLVNGAVTTGAGTPEANGEWVWNGEAYENGDGFLTQRVSGEWTILDSNFDQVIYQTTDPSENPWQNDTWTTAEEGTAPAPTFSQLTEPCTATFRLGNESDGYATFPNLPADEVTTVAVKDSEGNDVVVEKVGNDVVVPSLPYVPAVVADYSVDEVNPTVGEQIAFTDESTGSPDVWGWQFGDGDCTGLQNPHKIYLIPSVYTTRLFAGIAGNPNSSLKSVTDQITVAGILDTYGNAVIAAAPWLLYREYAGNGLRVRRSSDDTTEDIPFVDGRLDESAIETFVGANNGFAERAYLQNAGGLYFEQTTNGQQPQVVDSGSILIDGFSFPTLKFDGVNDRMLAAMGNYWGADRSKLWICGIIKPETSGGSTNLIVSEYETSSDDRCWRVVWNDDDKRIRVDYSVSGLFSLQIAEFSGMTTNETEFIFIQIDTAEAVATDRIKAWKTNESGTSAMTLASSSGDLTGDIHEGTGNILIGAQVPSSPSSFFTGLISIGGIGAELMPDASREAIQDYVRQYIRA